MMIKFIKNFIALLSFLIFTLFFLYKYNENYQSNVKLIRIDEEPSEPAKMSDSVGASSTNPISETKSLEDRAAEILDPYYTVDNINLELIVNAKDSGYKMRLIDLLNEFAAGDLKEIIGKERLNYIRLYDGTKIVGDSNVRHFDYYGVLEKEYYYPLAGYNITYQREHAEEYIDENTKRLIFWNGYNIAKYKDAEEYVEEYRKLIERVKEIKPDIKVYICSLMPATQEAIENDLKSDVVHNIYRGREYDAALKEAFGDYYINIKFMGKQHYYGRDGIHYMPKFYYMLVPYLAFYLSLGAW